ncbi:MAG: hypothetical protein HEP71_16785 [Roseivirga sp.]|nr:hypothetical protein [Roseivirga sp.]
MKLLVTIIFCAAFTVNLRAQINVNTATKFTVGPRNGGANSYFDFEGFTTLSNGNIAFLNFTYNSSNALQDTHLEIFNGSTGAQVSSNSILSSISPRSSDSSDDYYLIPLSNGNLLVSWSAQSSGKSFTDAYFRVIQTDGTTVTSAIKINNEAGTLNRFVRPAELSNGNVAFVWATDGSNYAYRIFQTDGTALANQASLTSLGTGNGGGSQSEHEIAANGNGTFMVVYPLTIDNRYKGIIFNNDGSATTVGGVNHFNISSVGRGGGGLVWVKALSNNNYVVTFYGDPDGIVANRDKRVSIFEPDGTAVLADQILEVVGNTNIGRLLSFTGGGFGIIEYSGTFFQEIDRYDNTATVVESDVRIDEVTDFLSDAFTGPDGSLVSINNKTVSGKYQLEFHRHVVPSSVPTSATVAATIILEGAWNGTNAMNTILEDENLVSASAPYNGINGHVGSESVASAAAVPDGVVDWVLVELREAGSAAAANNASRVGSAAGFLMSDGSIKATDGTSNLTVSLSGNTGADFFVVVYHRNHLPVMSANAISESGGTYSIDFTSSSANTYQTTNALVSLSGSKFGMPAGDTDSDGSIDGDDLGTWQTNNGAVFNYSSSGVADFNLDGEINAVDRNDFHQKNTSKTRQVPNS